MQCDWCQTTLRDGEEVVVETHGQIINGEFKQTEPAELHHVECEEGDE